MGILIGETHKPRFKEQMNFADFSVNSQLIFMKFYI